MKWFDRLLDTKRKRYLAVYGLVLVAIVYTSYHNFVLGQLVRQAKNISSLHQLILNHDISTTLLGRIVLLEFGLNLNIWGLLTTLQLPQWIIIFGLLLIFSAYGQPYNSKIKRYLFIVLLSLMIMYGAMIGYVLVASQSINVFVVTNSLKAIAQFLSYGSLVIALECLIFGYLGLEQMKEPLNNDK